MRPTDGARSEPKEFIYTSSDSILTGTKRPRHNESSSLSGITSMFTIGGSGSIIPPIIPTTVQSLTDSLDKNSLNSSLNLEEALNMVNSEELDRYSTYYLFSSNNSLIKLFFVCITRALIFLGSEAYNQQFYFTARKDCCMKLK